MDEATPAGQPEPEPEPLTVRELDGLRFVRVSDARVVPTAVSSSNGSVRGGFVPAAPAPDFVFQLRAKFEKDRGWVANMTRFRHGDPTGFPAPGEEPEHVAGMSIYIGPLHRHFGHFITESMTRIWYALRAGDPDVRLVVMPEVDSVEQRDAYTFDQLPSWQRGIFEYFGFTNLYFVKKQTYFEELVVPEQAAILFSRTHPEAYRDILAEHCATRFGKECPSRKIFYRRPRDAKGSKTAGEEYLSGFLARFGYETVFPGQLSVQEQLQVAAQASSVIGTQGSELHSFNLLGRSEARVFLLQRAIHNNIFSFIDSVEPYVGSITTYRAPAALPGKKHGRDLVLPEAATLATSLALFDPDIDPEAFDAGAFSQAVLADVTAFVAAGLLR